MNKKKKKKEKMCECIYMNLHQLLDASSVMAGIFIQGVLVTGSVQKAILIAKWNSAVEKI